MKKDLFIGPMPATCDTYEVINFTTPDVECPTYTDNSANDFFAFRKIVAFFKLVNTKICAGFHRMTADINPLAKYGREGTFTRAIAEKLATTGLTNAEYVTIAEAFKADVKRFKAYITYHKSQGFNFTCAEGRYTVC